MKKWVCTVCGYVYEGENAPEKCPQCGVPASKFKEQASEGMTWACEHEVGVAQGLSLIHISPLPAGRRQWLPGAEERPPYYSWTDNCILPCATRTLRAGLPA